MSSTYLSHIFGWVGSSTYSFLLKLLHVEISYYGAYQGPHSHTLNLFIALALEKKVSVFEAEFQ